MSYKTESKIASRIESRLPYTLFHRFHELEGEVIDVTFNQFHINDGRQAGCNDNLINVNFGELKVLDVPNYNETQADGIEYFWRL